jgi:hypothetical protein
VETNGYHYIHLSPQGDLCVKHLVFHVRNYTSSWSLTRYDWLVQYFFADKSTAISAI